MHTALFVTFLEEICVGYIMNNQIICSLIVQFGASWASCFSLLLKDEYVLVVLDEAYMLLSYGGKK